MSLEAFAVYDGGSGLVVFLFADPHLLECGQRGQDGSANPDGVLPFRRSDDLDLHRSRSEGSDLALHAVGYAGEHGRSSGQDRVGVQVLTDVNVTLHDGVVGRLVDSARLHADERWLEHSLRAPKPLVTNRDDLYSTTRTNVAAPVCY